MVQAAIDQKPNEITAISEELRLADLNGAIITIDAMGTEVENAGKIVDGGGDYVLALKGNQGTLSEEVIAMLINMRIKTSRKFRFDDWKKNQRRVAGVWTLGFASCSAFRILSRGGHSGKA